MRTSDRAYFAFEATLGIESSPADVALVLEESILALTKEQLGSLLQAARNTSSLVYVLQTKIDLIPRDLSVGHTRLLRAPAWFRYYRDVDCFPISVLTREGVDDLLSSIGTSHCISTHYCAHVSYLLADAVLPPPVHRALSLRVITTRFKYMLLDWIASIFVLPQGRLDTDVSQFTTAILGICL